MNSTLAGHLATIFRHWGKIVFVLIGALLVSGAIALLSSKVYVAEARILLLNRSPVERVTDRSLVDRTPSSPQEQVLTQVAIAKSPLLATRLAEALGPERVLDEMRWRWDWLRGLPGVWKDRLLNALAGWQPTRELLKRVGIRLPSDGGKGELVAAAREKLMRALDVEAIPKTDMFVMTISAPDADFAAEALNNLIDIYVEHVVALRRPVDTAAIAKHEAERLERELREAEQALQDYAKRYNILSIDKQKDLLLDRLARLQDERADAERAALEADRKLDAILNRVASLPSDESVSKTTRPNPVADRLRTRLTELETEARRFVPGSAAEARIKADIRAIRAQLRSAAAEVSGSQTVGRSTVYEQLQSTLALQQAERQALGVRVSFVERQLKATEDELRRLEEHELAYRELQRRVNSKEQAYQYAQQKREETVITDQISGWSLSHVVPVEPAEPPEDPSRPRRVLTILLGLVVGLSSGIGLAYGLEFTRGTMSTPREVELALGVRVLAALSRTGLFVSRKRENELEMRRFAAQLLNARGDARPMTLMIASALPKSGRSTVSRRTSAALRRQGAKVLQIEVVPGGDDAEARPRVCFVDNDGNAVEEIPAAESGEIELLRLEAPAAMVHEQIVEVLKRLGGAHDFVIVDAPALADFPEQLHIAGLLDGVLLVIEADRTRVREALSALDELRLANAKILGVVLNKQHHETASWAFGWMADTRRKLRERKI